MLVLSRKKGERIVVGGGVVITVVEVRGDKVRIGIDAPKDVVVDREEIFQQKLKERQEASASQGTGIAS